jgi:hypothetical protein
MLTKNCGLKHELLREYMAALEKLKVVQDEYEEVLAAGTRGRGIASRCVQRIKAIKALASEARMRFSVHRHEHRC